MEQDDELVVYGYSVGDMSVGIPSCSFEVKTGITKEQYKDTKNDRVYKTAVLKDLQDRMKQIPTKHFTVQKYINMMTECIINDLHDNGRLMIFKNTKEESDWCGEL